jgi:hypothetical protein
MGLVNTQFFVGTRCRLSRHKDAKFVNGWVQFFKGESLVVTTEDHMGSEPGDTFYVEAYGPKAKACMDAVLKTIDAEVSMQEEVEGQSVPLTKLNMQLKGHLQVVDNAEASRVMVDRMFATFQVNDTQFRAQVRDVSVKGIGLITDAKVSAGMEIEMRIGTSIGPVVAKGMVKHVREYRGKYRVGIELTDLGRLDGSRWRKLLGEAA